MPNPDDENLRVEYNVIGSYTTAATGARFQTIAIYLAAIGLIVSGGPPSSLSALLILIVSFGLWALDLRNRDLLARLGERGVWIEGKWGYHADPEPKEGGRGFFLDAPVPPRLRLLTLKALSVPKPLSPWIFTHAFGVDLVFLGVIGYALARLAGADDWPRALIALAPACAAIAFVAVVRFRERRARRA
jgi:hypothetical protein